LLSKIDKEGNVTVNRTFRPSSWPRTTTIAAAALAASTLAGCALFPPSLPERPPVERTVWLNQNWSNDARFWFHHASQGTSTIPVPYAWFVALEQPSIHLFSDPPLLSDPAYMARLGFISSPRSTGYAHARSEGYGTNSGSFTVAYDAARFAGNPDGLPVGFARTPGYVDPSTGAKLPDQVGLTCAACHTGQLTYRGTNVRIDGAPATTDLGKFRTILGLSLAYTRYVPGRFGRFADRVLGPDHSEQAEAELEAQLIALLEEGPRILAQMAPGLEGSVEEGFNRLDALNRIGNQLFFSDLVGTPEPGFDPAVNIRPTNAPVNYPATWSTSWFDWVQYDGSIMQPMVRNAGEALGVSARVNLTAPDAPDRPLFLSSVRIEELFHMEELLAGPDPQAAPKRFKGLAAPAWPSHIFKKPDGKDEVPDAKLVERGHALYTAHCAGCHRPAPNDPDGRFWDAAFWTTPNQDGLRFYKVPVIPVEKIGTDPAQATVLTSRTVKVPAYLGIEEPDPSGSVLCKGNPGTIATDTSFGWALAAVTGKVIDRWYVDHNIPPDRQNQMNGNRENCIRAPFGYKARPLNGVWATAPFLHNGSVPTLYDLLSPASERPGKFCLGNLEFDPVKVGYVTDCRGGTNEIDTGVPGNLNTGHSFEDGPRGKGVIGPKLEPADRMALVEYLKTL